MIKSFFIIAFIGLLPGSILLAQKQSFDVISYTIPKDWKKTVTDNGVQLSTKDDGKGNYAAAVIVRSVESTGTPNENFQNSWNNLVKGTVEVTAEPATSDMGIEKGWQLISGQSNYTHGAAKGIVTLITATGNGKMASVVIMSNTSKYGDEIMAFVNSLDLATTATSVNTNNQPNSTANTIKVNSAITGKIWESKTYEKHGAAYGNSSGFYSGGFWTYQYKFNADGTYLFVYNAASGIVNNPVNVLQYESGTYIVNGNQVTITPLKGANEEWSVGKVNNGMSAEHIREVLQKRLNLLKSTARKLEKTTYPFTVEYWQGNEANALCLKHQQNTVREGSPGANDQSCFFETSTNKAVDFSTLFK